MLSGLKQIKEASEKGAQVSQSGGDFIPTLILRDNGEYAILRFISSADEVIQANFHTIEEMSSDGRKRFRDILCTYFDKGSCEHCAKGVRFSVYIFLWSYVRDIIHKEQNPRIETNPSAHKWQQVKISGQIFYKEEVNKPMIFRIKPGRGGNLKNQLIDYAETYGTLNDRDYKFTRSGIRKDPTTSYSLTPKNPEEEPLVEKLREDLPALADFVTGKIRRFSEAKQETKEEKEGEVKEDFF